ncbi:thioredoxin 1 [Aromatoleum tolulyticum]|uniref:Thioredoxin 1 n=1 Tax=Aromatoleum tolulyticum TaxID=34027 RepID=A0A1N6U668_9RHOO|nr:thioredoxin family protein [Aromatoleum tolulyticum]SIQ61093.1 thioredoxin 1 [Aromatoleum tolulyticum]
MGSNTEYSAVAPDRKEIDALKDATVLEFGTGWCGFCRGAQPLIAEAFAAYPQVRHLKIEDGPGRPLGRSFRVKLWPTLVFLRDGVELARIVRPGSAAEIAEALQILGSASGSGTASRSE